MLDDHLVESVKLIECPRDAMQGIKPFIPTSEKIAYITQLLKVGFDTIDFGSFVSPKAIPQMKDTAAVVEAITGVASQSKLLAIVANERGANDAAAYPAIHYLGFPFSISETFQLRNTNSTIVESMDRVKSIQEICVKADKEMVLYVSMGFGNPYGDPWNVEIVEYWINQLIDLDIKIIQLSDTIGVANPANISYLFSNLIPAFPTVEFGAHFHTTPSTWQEKVDAAFKNGCIRFDGAIRGYGGCPMAKDELTGNMPMEHLVYYFKDKMKQWPIDESAFQDSFQHSARIFPN